jgi:hypothetical protein
MLGKVYCGKPGEVGSMVLWNELTLTLRAFRMRGEKMRVQVPRTAL